MTIGSLSALGNQGTPLAYPDIQQSQQQKRLDFQQLVQSLQNGNLGGAQQAFSALEQLMSASGASQGTTQNQRQGSQDNPLRTDLSAIGQALQSGDLAGAQTAYAHLQQDVQALRHTHQQANGLVRSAAGAAAYSDGDGDGSRLNVTA